MMLLDGIYRVIIMCLEIDHTTWGSIKAMFTS